MSPLAAASPLKALDPNVLANADTPVDAKNILKSRLRPKPRAHSPSAKSFGDIGDDDDDDDDSAYEANRRRAKPKADAKGGDLFDAFSKTQNDASSLIDEFKRRCEERSASRGG